MLPKERLILETNGEWALVYWMGKECQPFVVAWLSRQDFDKKRGDFVTESWYRGHYFDTLSGAVKYFKSKE